MQQKKSIVLFHSELDTVNLFSEQLKHEFTELGYEIYEFDLCDLTRSLGLFYEYMKEHPITAMIGFNSTLYGLKLPSGKNVWETLGIPCINVLMDHPFWYHDMMMRTPSTGIVLCVDRNHMNYVNRFYPNIPSNGFLAHGGITFSGTHKPIAERKIDIMYAGSLYASYIPKEIDFSVWKFSAKEVFDKSVEYLFAHTEETIETVVEKQLKMAGVTLPDEELRIFISFCVYIERIISSHYREKIVSSIAKAGISLELYGEGWAACDWIKLPNVHYGGRVTPKDIVLKMEDCKLVLNTVPWFKDGSHDRVFNAMMCGAVAVSETSKYFEEVLPADTWVSFDLLEESLLALPGRIQELLDDDDRLQKMADAGHELASASHTWKARALELHNDLLSFL